MMQKDSASASSCVHTCSCVHTLSSPPVAWALPFGGVLKLADFGLSREFADPPEPCTTNARGLGGVKRRQTGHWTRQASRSKKHGDDDNREQRYRVSVLT